MRCDGDENVIMECRGKVVTPDDECDSKYYAGVMCSGCFMLVSFTFFNISSGVSCWLVDISRPF